MVIRNIVTRKRSQTHMFEVHTLYNLSLTLEQSLWLDCMEFLRTKLSDSQHSLKLNRFLSSEFHSNKLTMLRKTCLLLIKKFLIVYLEGNGNAKLDFKEFKIYLSMLIQLSFSSFKINIIKSRGISPIEETLCYQNSRE